MRYFNSRQFNFLAINKLEKGGVKVITHQKINRRKEQIILNYLLSSTISSRIKIKSSVRWNYIYCQKYTFDHANNTKNQVILFSENADYYSKFVKLFDQGFVLISLQFSPTHKSFTLME